MENYLNLITKVEPKGWRDINGINCRTWYHVGDNFLIEVGITEHDRANRNDLANLWVKHGHLDHFLPTTAHITTYYTDKEGRYSGLYNIQHKRDNTIDFNYMLEATPENINRLIAECIRMYEMNIA